jgi:TonB-linked SusC/RagA family outer membrane protein
MKKNLLSLLLLSFFALSSAFAQSRKITGTVTGSDDGQPLPGVTVKVQAGVGVQTNTQGQFSINVPASAKSLVVSYVGFIGQTVPITSESVINVQLIADNKALSEVVVVGYGTGSTLSSTVGNVARVSSKDIQDKPAANALDAIQGRVPGLQVLTSSGEPSASPSISINGISSLTSGTTPLIILDGTPVALASVLTLNPDDIESVSVLKDASSTSIYGARAANGVLYITTKHGSANAPQTITLSSSYGTEKLANTQYYNSFFNAAQYNAFEIATGVETPAALAIQQQTYNADTKWYKVYFKPSAPIYNENISISGGTDKTTYFISGGFFKEDGLEYRSLYDRYTLRSNVTSKVTDWLKVGLNLSMAYDNRLTNQFNTNSLSGGLSVLAPPIYSPVNAQGVPYEFIPGWGNYAPYYYEAKHPDFQNNTQFNPTGFLEITPIKGLTIKTQAGMDAFDFRETTQVLPSYLGSPNNGSDIESFQRGTSLTFTNTVEYKFNLKSLNHFTALVGQEYSDNTTSTFSGQDTGQSDDRLVTLTTGTAAKNANSSYYELDFKSLFSRVDYDYNNRYFLEASFRQDKSSVFGANHQSANFYSIGASWKAKQENFFKDISWLTDLTVRASTGTTGNSSLGGGAAQYQQLASVSVTPYGSATGFQLSQPGDPNLTWETVRNTQIGFTTTLFNKLNLDASFYLKTTTNMLLNVPFVGTSGFTSQIQNVGSLENKGIDVDLSYTVYSDPSHRAYVTPHFNANFNANKIVSLFQGRQYYISGSTGILWAVGKPISYVDPVWAGVNPTNGLPQWYLPSSDPAQIVNKTTNNGVTNTFNTTLQQNLGIDRYPWSTGGFGVSAGYEGITLDANFAYNKGKYITNNDQYFVQNPNQFTGYNQQTAVLSYWQNPGDITTFPKYGQQFTQFDSRLIQDASFIRLKTITLGYSLPKAWLAKTKVVKRFEIDFTGRNLLTFTPYKGIDPEVNSNIALGNNPNTKQYVVGLKATF